jgi:hypothetical protein
MKSLSTLLLLSALFALPAAAQDSAVVINELQYHPENETTQTEWIEIRCLHGVDVDISNWELEGGVNFTFPAGTVIPGRGMLIIARNPAALSGVTALGPWTGNLSNSGEEVRLVNNSDRVMDRITYSDDGDWPVGPDGSGATLARRDQASADSGPAAWAASNQLGGTPGSSNFLDADSTPSVTTPVLIDSAAWKYSDSNSAPPADWRTAAFNDTAWSTGRALFYNGAARIADPVPATTILTGPGDGLRAWWAMDDTVGSATAANSAPGGTVGTLNGSVGTNIAFTTDTAPRSKVLRVNMTAANANVTGSWVAAGNLPQMTMVNDFTWAFWARSNVAPATHVIFGNRYNGPGATDFNPREFIKFTGLSFEWHVNGVGQDINYADIPNGSWIHHAVVKQGAALIYYRNGSVAGNVTIGSAPFNVQPLFMGGNGTEESWSGFLDDVALWNKALPAASVAALAANTHNPGNVPTIATLVDNGPWPVPPSVQFPVTTTTPLTDSFAGTTIDTAKWEVIDQGLENTTPSGLTAVQNEQITFAGTTAVNYWAGKSLRSVQTYSTRNTVTAEVDRVSLAGTGTAYRSSLWLWADANHYLHFSQNIGEGGWSYNANDLGGTGTLNPTGGGNNLGSLDFVDANAGLARMKLVWVPGAYPGQGTIQIWRDATLAGSHSVTNWPASFKVMLTGQARQATPAADSVTAVFDNASVSVAEAQPLQTVVNQATTHYFRHGFSFSGDPALTTLTLWPIHDDAAVYYLNGTEFHRDNITASPSHGTLATNPVGDPSFPRNPITVPAGLLASGTNVLAVEVHQDSASSPDMMFGAQLQASTLPAPARDNPALRFTEISAAVDANFRVELRNSSATPLNLAAFTLRDSNGQTFAFSGSLAAGQYVVFDETQIGWRPIDGARLFLVQGDQYYDGRTVTGRLRGLTADGQWAYPAMPTFGTFNAFNFNDAIVINEIMFNAPGDSPEEWVELYNRGGSPVDVSGWQFTDGITYEFPAGTPPIPAGGFAVVVWDIAAFNALHPGVPRVFGPFTDGLSGTGERIRLRDAAGNLADEVRYAEGGSWPLFTGGTASSIELRNAFADNANGGVWAASDETSRGTWQNVDYPFQGTVFESDPTYYSELILGLLNDGEVLIDDISVRQDPAGTNVELIQNGNFTVGTTDKWRLTGNTRRSTVVDDPDSPGNKVLKLVQSGSIDHMSNHLETTLRSGTTLLGAGTGATGTNAALNYRISFRARWWKGNNALNSHLYFNRGPVTTLLNRPATGGTPGAVNSTASAAATLTLGTVTHTPAVPTASQTATVTAKVHDPTGIANVKIFYVVNENPGPEQEVTMSYANGLWTGSIPGQAAGAKVNFRIQAVNLAAQSAQWPANGLAGRAMIPWDDGQAQLVRPSGARPHNVRIVMTASDTTLLHALNNVMSNDFMPCTIIYDEREVYYNCRVHLKGSEHGRAKTVRVGFSVRFPAENLFLGVHEEMGIDRSGAGDQYSQKEILVKRSMNRAGGIPCTEDDLIRVIAPQTAHTGPAICIHGKLDSDTFLDGQWSSGSDGTLFEYELLYPLTTTDNGTLEGNKLTQDSPGPTGVSVRKLNPGTSKEEYRWYWLIKNNRNRDDYTGLIAALTALGQSGATFHTQTAPLLDTDGWLRSFTGPVAWAAGDNYAYNSQHNALYYVKPDGRTLYIPWDMDFTASSGATANVVPNTELGKLINSVAGLTADDVNRRAYYGHLLHMVNTGFNPGYLDDWMDHYSKFVNEDYRANFLPFVTQRETHIRTQISAAIPVVPFLITTNGGNNYTEANSTTILAGDGWVNVATIRLAGGEPLTVTWTDDNSWSLTLPVLNGPNVFNLEARDGTGALVGTDSITVTGTGGVVPASSANLILTELNYHPVTAGEEFIEMQNVSAFTVDLGACTFTAGISYTFPAGTLVAPGARLLLVENRTAFTARYPTVPLASLAPGAYTPSNLSNGGETLTLQAADGLSDVFSANYNDDIASTDGLGRSLVRAAGNGVPADYYWRESMADGGNPNTSDALPFTGDPLADLDFDNHSALIEYAFGTSDTVWTPSTFFMAPNGTDPPITAAPLPNADFAALEFQSSSDLTNWSTDPSTPPGRVYWRWRATLR